MHSKIRQFRYFFKFCKEALSTGMRLGFGKNSGKFYVAIDSSPIQHSQF